MIIIWDLRENQCKTARVFSLQLKCTVAETSHRLTTRVRRINKYNRHHRLRNSFNNPNMFQHNHRPASIRLQCNKSRNSPAATLTFTQRPLSLITTTRHREKTRRDEISVPTSTLQTNRYSTLLLNSNYFINHRLYNMFINS